jgi:hypothetical protein
VDVFCSFVVFFFVNWRMTMGRTMSFVVPAMMGLLAVCRGGPIFAEQVAELQFSAAAANGSGATVKMESHAQTADGEVKLQGDGTNVTKIELAPTGISDKWSPLLREGYLEVAEFANYGQLNKVGVSTTAPGKDYLFGGEEGGFGSA